MWPAVVWLLVFLAGLDSSLIPRPAAALIVLLWTLPACFALTLPVSSVQLGSPKAEVAAYSAPLTLLAASCAQVLLVSYATLIATWTIPAVTV